MVIYSRAGIKSGKIGRKGGREEGRVRGIGGRVGLEWIVMYIQLYTNKGDGCV